MLVQAPNVDLSCDCRKDKNLLLTKSYKYELPVGTRKSDLRQQPRAVRRSLSMILSRVKAATLARPLVRLPACLLCRRNRTLVLPCSVRALRGWGTLELRHCSIPTRKLTHALKSSLHVTQPSFTVFSSEQIFANMSYRLAPWKTIRQPIS